MKNTSIINTLALTSALITMTPHAAFADGGEAHATSTNPSVIQIKNNGQSYTQLDFVGNFAIIGKLTFDTGTSGKIKSWKVTPTIRTGTGIWVEIPGLSSSYHTKSYPKGNRPKSINENLFIAVNSSKIAKHAIGMCNQKASSLRQQGMSNQQIFAQNYDVYFDILLHGSVDSTGAGSNKQIWEGGDKHKMKIRCMKWAGSQIPSAAIDIKTKVKVNKATMNLKEVSNLGGTCRVDTTTAIATTQANATLKYRFVHSTGKKSNIFTTKTKANKIAVVKHKWDIPAVNGPENGWVRIEGISPNFKSNIANYSMNCNKTGDIGGIAIPQHSSKRKVHTGQ